MCNHVISVSDHGMITHTFNMITGKQVLIAQTFNMIMGNRVLITAAFYVITLHHYMINRLLNLKSRDYMKNAVQL